VSDRTIIREERHRDYAVNRIKALTLATPWEVTIKPYKRNRSLEQNNLYWKWIALLGADLGYTKDEMHEELMRKHLIPVCINTPSGVVEVFSTKQLKVGEMSEYLNNVLMTATQMGIALPRPEDQGIL